MLEEMAEANLWDGADKAGLGCLLEISSVESAYYPKQKSALDPKQTKLAQSTMVRV